MRTSIEGPEVISRVLVGSRNTGVSQCALSALLAIFLLGAVDCAELNTTGHIKIVNNAEINETPILLWNEKPDHVKSEIVSTGSKEMDEDEDIMAQIFLLKPRARREIKKSDLNDKGSGIGEIGEVRNKSDYLNNFHQIIGKIGIVADDLRSSILQLAKQKSGSARYALCVFQSDPAVLSPLDKNSKANCVYLPTPNNMEKKDNVTGLVNSTTQNTTDAPKLTTPSTSVSGPLDRKNKCEDGYVACQDGTCIWNTQWCNAKVDCDDGSDEANCSCTQRIDKIRICDNYMDCPNGEDENGCHGCPKSTHFSCTSLGPHSTKTQCVPLIKRCDGRADCPSGSDEEECFALLDKPLNSGQVDMQSHISGYLHINSHGQWFPLCTKDPEAALSACKAESEPNVKLDDIKIDEHTMDMKKFGNVIAFPTSLCGGIKVIHVECPPPQCGTRILDEALIESPIEKRMITNRIVGGTLSKPTAWPFLVAVFRDGRFHCGGSLIGDSWVLSAAHCVHDYTKHFYEIQAGMLRRRSFAPQEQTRVVTHVIMHDEYNRDAMINDLALLKVNFPVRMSRWARPICLPPPGIAHPGPGTNCIAVGWGAVKEQGYDPDQIHEVDVPILETCKNLVDRNEAEICAGLPEGGKDACKGDSGGPLLCRQPHAPDRWYVAGVVSHGEGCARPNEPGAYTRVGIFIDWINNNTANESTLPLERPINKCPGIECSKVGSRCLSASMICDRFVDCLEAEDELDCKTRDVNSKFRYGTSASRFPISDEDAVGRLKMFDAFHTLKDAGLPKETADDVHRFLKQKLNQTNENGAFRAFNSSKIWGNATISPLHPDPSFGTSTTVGPPSVVEATLEPLYSSPNESSAKVKEEYGGGEDEEEDQFSGESAAYTELDVSTTGDESNARITTLEDTTTVQNEPRTIEITTRSLHSEEYETTTQTAINTTDAKTPQISADKLERPSSVFRCSHYHEVPLSRKCDGFKDCEDGSDEANCSCKDYLLKIEPSLICNGVLDCADRSDEHGCGGCHHGEFYCPLSKTCVKLDKVCDRKNDCHMNEDENHCFTLLSGPFVMVDDNEQAIFRKSGYLGYKYRSSWYYWCVKDRIEAEKLAASSCSRLGFSSYTKFTIKPELVTAPLPITSKDKLLRRGHNDNPIQKCNSLWIDCGNRIKTWPSKSTPNCGESSWPWFAALYLDGNYLCGATIIDQHWLITSKNCVQNVNLNYHFLAALMGTNRQLAMKAPFEQTRRIAMIQKLEFRDVALLFMDSPITITRQVMPLQLKERDEKIDAIDHCIALGPDNSLSKKLISIQFKPVSCGLNNNICLEPVCSSPDVHCKDKVGTKFPWSGALACQDRKGIWFPFAVYFEPSGSCGFKTPMLIEKLLNFLPYLKNPTWSSPRSPYTLVPPPCNGLRCPLGRCVHRYNLCDGLADCRDGSDEVCQYNKNSSCCYKMGNTFSCVCGPNQFLCRNGVACVDKSKFCDGVNDCGDASDEPSGCPLAICRAYLRLTDPYKICDGNVHCRDKTDEIGCACTSSSFRCAYTGVCIPLSFLCDGAFDCPHGDDERNCFSVRTKLSSPASGNVVKKTFGTWYEFCPPTDMNVTAKHALSRELCRHMGFLGNNARFAQSPAPVPVLQPFVDLFYKIRLNNKTTIEMRPSSRRLMELTVEVCPTTLYVDCGKPLRN